MHCANAIRKTSTGTSAHPFPRLSRMLWPRPTNCNTCKQRDRGQHKDEVVRTEIESCTYLQEGKEKQSRKEHAMGRRFAISKSPIRPNPAMAQIQNPGFTTWANISRKLCKPSLSPMMAPYSREYANVQNQNFWKPPVANRTRQVTAKGRSVPTTRAPAFGVRPRQSSRPSQYSLLARYKMPNTANRIPGCFIRKANPNRTPLPKKSQLLLLSIAVSRSRMPPSAASTTKCVACPAKPSTDGLVDSRA